MQSLLRLNLTSSFRFLYLLFYLSPSQFSNIGPAARPTVSLVNENVVTSWSSIRWPEKDLDAEMCGQLIECIVHSIVLVGTWEKYRVMHFMKNK